MDKQSCSSASYFIFKTETWQTTSFANNIGRPATHNVLRQTLTTTLTSTRFAKSQCSEISDIFTLFLQNSLRKITCQWTNYEGAIAYRSLWKPMDDKEFKIFLDVIILIGVYKSNNSMDYT